MGRMKVKAPVTDMAAVQAYEEEMGFVPFTAVIIYMKQPYLDWANGQEDMKHHPGGVSLDQMNDEPPVFLIEYEDNITHPERWVKRNWEVLFMEELNGWSTDPATWPADRTWEMFKEWFRWEWSTTVRQAGKDLKLSFDPEDGF